MPKRRLSRWSLPAPQRKDASMTLLTQILENPVDPDYANVAASGNRPRHRGRLFCAAAAIGALLAVSVLQTLEAAPLVADQRARLLEQVEAGNARIAQQRVEIAALQETTERRRDELLAGDAEAERVREQIAALDPLVGGVAVAGSGVRIVVDDSEVARNDRLNEVLDGDLQLLVNGLWRAGAEAVAINGHRLTSTSAIRAAGHAITVNYRSLTRPYTVEAIGPDELEDRFMETAEGHMWEGLRRDYGVSFSVQTQKRVELAAEPAWTIRHARVSG